MASRKKHREERRRLEAARQQAEHEEQRRKRRFQLAIVGASMLVAFALVLGATILAGGGSSSSEGATEASSNTSVPSSVGTVGGSARVEEGGRFPDFQLTEAGGESLTLGSLAGQSAIVWFTTSYCVPCQVGALDVRELDDELGGEAFDVLVVFVDAGEPMSAMTGWRDEFGNDDWMVALDEKGDLAEAVKLQFLDSKFLLDPEGVITDIDLEIVDDDYLDLVRNAAT